jgi:SAM-dependent methyltransferase
MDDADRAALAEQYADAENLDARVELHENYEVTDRDWWPWVFDHYEGLPADADLLEVGCGTGYLGRDNADRVPAGWDLLATDFSQGMAAEARATLADAGVAAGVAVAAAESLPLPDDSVDAVVANHMLYHTDRDATLPEVRRVLRPGGWLFATTNGESNLRELRELLAAVSGYEPVSASEFSLESGPDQLARCFDTVERYERESRLRVPELEPLVAYAASLQGVDEPEVTEFADLAAERLADGPLVVHKSMGLLVAETR